MRKHAWLGYLLAYLAWAVALALGIWLLLVSRDAVLAVASALMVDNSTARFWRLTSIERFYVVGAGLVWIALMVVSEFYFRNGVRRGHLFQRFARILGVELLLLFLADVVLFWMQGLSFAAWSRWLILAAELLLGVGLCRFARTSPRIFADIKAGDEV